MLKHFQEQKTALDVDHAVHQKDTPDLRFFSKEALHVTGIIQG